MYADDDLLPLSGLQHIAFCERQWALIHVERIWTENRLTAEGRLLHSRVDEPEIENRPGIRIVRAMPVRSLRLGISGVCDVVEYSGPDITPVEYKRGKPKRGDCDEVQLCAQAMCIEEMTGAALVQASLFYGAIRRRSEVALDARLRGRVERLWGRGNKLVALARTPPAVFGRWCRSCSLQEDCLPESTNGDRSAQAYLRSQVSKALREGEP